MVRIRKPKRQRKTTCSGCGLDLEKSRLMQRYCKICHAKSMRKNRPGYSELTEFQRRKVICRAYANTYIRRGQLQKQPCELCGEYAQMHHEDYSKPLQIRWFCRSHHLELHKKQKELLKNN